MRTTRALIAGFGTTGTLVAAVACVFAVASAVVAFNGWPNLGIGDRIDSLFVKDRPTVAFDSPGPQVECGEVPRVLVARVRRAVSHLARRGVAVDVDQTRSGALTNSAIETRVTQKKNPAHAAVTRRA